MTEIYSIMKRLDYMHDNAYEFVAKISALSRKAIIELTFDPTWLSSAIDPTTSAQSDPSRSHD